MTEKTLHDEVLAPTSEPPATNVVEALRRVMRDLPAIAKAKDPNGGVAYAFRGIEAITKEAQGLCVQHGVIFTPRVVGTPEVVDITVNNKPWTDTRMLVEYSVYGPGGGADAITVGPIFAIGRDNSDKGANKCMTQAFKYALIQTFMIADAKDDGDAVTAEADDWGSRAEQGNPTRVSTLRSDVKASDVERMRLPEVTARLKAAGLSDSGTLKHLRERLVEHLEKSSLSVGNAPGGAGELIGVPGQEPVLVGPTTIVVGTEAIVCSGCGNAVGTEPDGPASELGVEDDDGRLWHAGCFPQ